MANPTSPQASLARVSEEMLESREELADLMVGEIHARVEEFAGFDGPELWESVRASCLANLDTGLRPWAAIARCRRRSRRTRASWR